MQDHELYRRILGIEAPWFADSVELELEAGQIFETVLAVRLGPQSDCPRP